MGEYFWINRSILSKKWYATNGIVLLIKFICVYKVRSKTQVVTTTIDEMSRVLNADKQKIADSLKELVDEGDLSVKKNGETLNISVCSDSVSFDEKQPKNNLKTT